MAIKRKLPRSSKPLSRPLPQPLPDLIPRLDVPWPRPPWRVDLGKFFGDCKQRILFVADGGLDFSASNGFGLTETISALTSGAPGFIPVSITTAHRSAGNGATYKNFRFDSPPVALTRANFDQLWLFGIARETTRNSAAGKSAKYNPSYGLNNAEIKAIAAFMNSGGGVFATGDHGRLGFAMCGTLPRVRQMRNWVSIPMGMEITTDPDGRLTALRRIDTMADPMSNADYEFDDQSDVFPQRLYPHYRRVTRNGPWVPHPLLSSPTRVIDVFPDHPHESECTVAGNPTATYHEAGLKFPEFPVAGGNRPLPELVASSMSGGRFLRTNPADATVGKPPVTPRSFGAISAYNGDAVKRGRIVCDATWHHFININLNGIGTPSLPGLGSIRTGFLSVPAVYNQIKRYYSNIARWLAPVGRRRCHSFLDLVDVRFSTMLIEELPMLLPDLPDPPPWPLLRELGMATRSALASRTGEAMVDDMLNEMLLDSGSATTSGTALRNNSIEPSLFDLESVRLSLIGGFMHHFAMALPDTAEELVLNLTRKKAHDIANKTLESAARQSSAQLGSQIWKSARRDLERFEKLGHEHA